MCQEFSFYFVGMSLIKTFVNFSLCQRTMFTDAIATVVLASYEGVILNELGMRMEMVGPGDIIRLRKTCELCIPKSS